MWLICKLTCQQAVDGQPSPEQCNLARVAVLTLLWLWTATNHCSKLPWMAAYQLLFCLQVVQPDKFTLSLRLRTPLSQGWLHLSWHPTAARVCMGQPPYRGDVTEAFSLAEQVGAQHHRCTQLQRIDLC